MDFISYALGVLVFILLFISIAVVILDAISPSNCCQPTWPTLALGMTAIAYAFSDQKRRKHYVIYFYYATIYQLCRIIEENSIENSLQLRLDAARFFFLAETNLYWALVFFTDRPLAKMISRKISRLNRLALSGTRKEIEKFLIGFLSGRDAFIDYLLGIDDEEKPSNLRESEGKIELRYGSFFMRIQGKQPAIVWVALTVFLLILIVELYKALAGIFLANIFKALAN